MCGSFLFRFPCTAFVVRSGGMSVQLEVRNLAGEVVGQLEVSDFVFGIEPNVAVMHQALVRQHANKRLGTHSTLTRGEVRGGGRKPWRQKGTGRARAGSSRSPLWTGGGTVFGPSPRHYTFKVNRKARRAALRSALSLHAERGSLAVLDGDGFDAPSTRRAAELLAGWDQPAPTLVVVAEDEVAAAKSFRNLSRATLLVASDAGVADIVAAASLVVSRSALDQLTARATAERATAGAEGEEG